MTNHQVHMYCWYIFTFTALFTETSVSLAVFKGPGDHGPTFHFLQHSLKTIENCVRYMTPKFFEPKASRKIFKSIETFEIVLSDEKSSESMTLHGENSRIFPRNEYLGGPRCPRTWSSRILTWWLVMTYLWKNFYRHLALGPEYSSNVAGDCSPSGKRLGTRRNADPLLNVLLTRFRQV